MRVGGGDPTWEQRKKEKKGKSHGDQGKKKKRGDARGEDGQGDMPPHRPSSTDANQQPAGGGCVSSPQRAASRRSGRRRPQRHTVGRQPALKSACRPPAAGRATAAHRRQPRTPRSVRVVANAAAPRRITESGWVGGGGGVCQAGSWPLSTGPATFPAGGGSRHSCAQIERFRTELVVVEMVGLIAPAPKS